MAEWYYIGHYGQIGPLTRESIKDLIDSGVVLRDTFVWKTGNSDWVPASACPELDLDLAVSSSPMVPPPPPGSTPMTPSAVPNPMHQPPPSSVVSYSSHYPTMPTMKSDRSRIAAGLLQLFIPGVGRMYLGYVAIGVLQLLTSMCGIGIIWAWIDALVILTGGVRYDGYMRRLDD